jgi:hypothetical protein
MARVRGLGSTALYASTIKAAIESNATVAPERQRLLDLAPDQQMEVLIEKVLKGSAPRAAAISVGITSKQFSTRMENDPEFRNLVFRSAHQAEGSVAENLYAQATGRSPQNVQAAIAWLEKRMPEVWGREAQRLEIEVTGAVDVNHILSDPRLILEVNRHEAELQRLEDDAIDAEFRQLPSHDEMLVTSHHAPPLPDSFDENPSGPLQAHFTPPVKDSIPEMRPNRNRIIKVSGVDTLIGDERSPKDRDDRPHF